MSRTNGPLRDSCSIDVIKTADRRFSVPETAASSSPITVKVFCRTPGEHISAANRVPRGKVFPRTPAEHLAECVTGKDLGNIATVTASCNAASRVKFETPKIATNQRSRILRYHGSHAS